MKKPELLAPAGNLEKLNIALHYGADAVYCGLPQFSLRAKTTGFDEIALNEARRLSIASGRKLYITCNIFPHNNDITPIREHAGFLKELKPDGIILSDPGIFDIVSSEAPEIPIHISTQTNITNFQSARFWERMGARRIVLSRELNTDEIKKIRDSVSIELECFVHGSICISYSGRCYLSAFMANRSANTGECTNTCRWKYSLVEEKRPDESFPIQEDARGTYILSAKDLRMLEHLDTLYAAGVDSFKLEGRMKGINYLAGVVKTYREAIDLLAEGNFSVQKEWDEELSNISHRGYTTGMYFSNNDANGYNHNDEKIHKENYQLLGVVIDTQPGSATVALRTKIIPGSFVRFLSPGIETNDYPIHEIRNEKGEVIPEGKNGDVVIFYAPNEVRKNDLIRRPATVDDHPASSEAKQSSEILP